MITLLIGISVLAGVSLAWFGYKTSLRIQAWGRGMDECDRIFQTVGGELSGAEFDQNRKRPQSATLIATHLRPGAAGSK